MVSLLFYHQQICKHLKNCLFFLPRAPGFFFWNLSKLRGKVLLNVGEAMQVTCDPNTSGGNHCPQCTVLVACTTAICVCAGHRPTLLRGHHVSHSAWFCSANSSTLPLAEQVWMKRGLHTKPNKLREALHTHRPKVATRRV